MLHFGKLSNIFVSIQTLHYRLQLIMEFHRVLCLDRYFSLHVCFHWAVLSGDTAGISIVMFIRMDKKDLVCQIANTT